MARRNFSKEFKEEAVHLTMANGYTQTGRDLGVHPNLLLGWRRQLEEAGEKASRVKGIRRRRGGPPQA